MVRGPSPPKRCWGPLRALGTRQKNNWGSWEPEEPSRPAQDELKSFHVLAAKRFLGAEDCLSRSDLKKVLVGISQTEHPDRGGNPARWRMVMSAYNFLISEFIEELPMSYDS